MTEADDDDVYDAGSNVKHMSRVSSGIMQLGFMRKTYNQLERSKRKGANSKSIKTRVFPTVLKPDDAPVTCVLLFLDVY